MSTSGYYDLVEDLPSLDAPVLVVWFDGFMDAGRAGGGFVSHVLDTLPHQVIAEFDTDLLIDYRARRPTMTFREGSYQDFEEPRLTLYLVHDDGGSPFLLLAGLEPDVLWNGFTAAVVDLIERLGVRLTVTVHGIPNPVPHTRPIGVLMHASRPGLVPPEQVFDADVRLPGSALGLLTLRLTQNGDDVVGIVARVPHYLAESDYPQASLALLRSVNSTTGLMLPADGLVDLSAQADTLVEREIAGNEQVARVVKALENQYDAFAEGQARGSLMADERAIPTGDEIADEFERFLAEFDFGGDDSRGPDDQPDDPGR